MGNRDRDQFAGQIVHYARQALAPLPADLKHREALPERMSIFAHSLLVEIDQGGGSCAWRLSPKGQSESDLVAKVSLPGMWHRRDTVQWTLLDDEIHAFLDALDAEVKLADKLAVGDKASMHHLLVAACRIVEDGYELVPQYLDEQGHVERQGDDIAPGLVAAVEAEWAAGR